MIEQLAAFKDIAILLLLGYIIYNLIGFERSWREDKKTAARLIDLNQQASKIAFSSMFVATVLSSTATFFLSMENYGLMTMFFDICLVFWAGFFKIMNDTVQNSDHLWFG